MRSNPQLTTKQVKHLEKNFRRGHYHLVFKKRTAQTPTKVPWIMESNFLGSNPRSITYNCVTLSKLLLSLSMPHFICKIKTVLPTSKCCNEGEKGKEKETVLPKSQS